MRFHGFSLDFDGSLLLLRTGVMRGIYLVQACVSPACLEVELSVSMNGYTAGIADVERRVPCDRVMFDVLDVSGVPPR